MNGHLEKTINPHKESGFTLVELAIAVVILGAALTILVGLQTRIVDGYIHEKKVTYASLYAQYILALIEVESGKGDIQTKQGDLEAELKELGYFDDSLDGDDIFIKGWTFEQQVTDVDIPPLEDALQRVDLVISWGNGSGDQFNLVYFIKKEKQQGSTLGLRGT